MLGQPWRSAGDDVDELSLLGRVEPFGLGPSAKIPADVLCLTIGADCQDDRIECSLVGWSRSGDAFVLGHQVVYGPITGSTIWIDLDDVLKQRFAHPHGGSLGVDAAIVDAGSGGHYDLVMKFCEARAARRVWAGKGVAGFARPAFHQSAPLKNRPGQRLYLFGADFDQELLLFARLARGLTIRFSR